MPSDILAIVVNFLVLSWWFWAFLFLLPLAISTWLYWRQEDFKHELEWAFLELKIPREIKKNPRAMEQVLTSIYSFRNSASDFGEKWLEGEVTRWYALEMASFGGETHFYVRTFKKQKAIMEAAFLSYYPDLEIEEVEDYAQKLPATVKEMYDQGYNLWSADYKLNHEDAYPIKSYIEFEAPAEEKEYDPMSAFLELFSKLKKEEIVGIQFLIAPTGKDWRDKYDSLIDELRTNQTEPDKMKTNTFFPGGPLPRLEAVKPGQEEGTSQIFRSFMRTPGETDVLEAVENNLSKLAFDTIIRFVYLSPKELFNDTYPRRGIQSAFDQFAALDLNSFTRVRQSETRIRFWYWPHFFPVLRVEWRKARGLYNYRNRVVPPETFMGRVFTSHFLNWNFASHRFILNTESIATLFHPPTYMALTAPHMKRVESRKAGPPAGTAVFVGEEEIERFK